MYVLTYIIVSSDYSYSIEGLGKDTVCNSKFSPRGKM